MAAQAKAKKAAAATGSASRPGKGPARKAKKDPAGAGDEAGRLRAECTALKAELKAAREEIARLEKRQELVVNRIDWVIDSLHNLLDDEA